MRLTPSSSPAKTPEFNGSGAGGDLYLRADGMLTIENNASASFTYFNGKGVLNVLNATFKSLNFNIADSGRLTFANGAKATLGSSDDAKKTAPQEATSPSRATTRNSRSAVISSTAAPVPQPISR